MNDTIKGSMKSKTMWFSILLAALSAVELGFEIFQPLLTPAMFGITGLVISVIIAVLRVYTTTSLSEK